MNTRRGKAKGGRFSTLAVLILAELRRTGGKTCVEIRERFHDSSLEQIAAACMELCNAQPEPSAEFNGAKYVAVEHAAQPVASKSRRN